MPLHVSSTRVRRPKLYYTASGIITHIGGRPVHRLRCTVSKISKSTNYRFVY